MANEGELGTVSELARAWRLEGRLRRAMIYGDALDRCLDCKVEASDRAKTVAGSAFMRERRIVLNAALFKPGREKDRNATFLHECAHIIANLHKRRDCGHGIGWRGVMETLGEPADRCHSIRYLSPKAHAIVTWQCRGCGQEYHFVRRPRRRPENCWCAKCGPRQGQLALHWEAAPPPRPAKPGRKRSRRARS
ncbi:MAG: SprT family zinc-dependent metalloprotease [Alphaproteobacteria bacterium]|nr:SprT family zinc-dependent metalloprotease [Alphaproteobacteria bacterium]